MQFDSHFFELNGKTFHVKCAGPKDAPLIVMLHGFPEYWIAWSQVASCLKGHYRFALPDQRGFNLSAAPQEGEAYHTKHLVADMQSLIQHLSPNAPVILCGHDWGASVAYALAMRHPALISHLIIANGVHPFCFQKALLAGGAQTKASQYMTVLRAEGSEERLSANNYEKLMAMFEKFSSAPWCTDKDKEQYRAAWSRPNILSAMLHWYRQSPMIVPALESPKQELPLTAEALKKYKVPMPHLLLWGMSDTALLPEAREDLAQFCPQLTVKEKQDGSHWILHEHPQWVADQMQEFFS